MKHLFTIALLLCCLESFAQRRLDDFSSLRANFDMAYSFAPVAYSGGSKEENTALIHPLDTVETVIFGVWSERDSTNKILHKYSYVKSECACCDPMLVFDEQKMFVKWFVDYEWYDGALMRCDNFDMENPRYWVFSPKKGIGLMGLWYVNAVERDYLARVQFLWQDKKLETLTSPIQH